MPAAVGQRREVPPRDQDGGVVAGGAGEGDDVIAMRSLDRQRPIVPLREDIGERASPGEQPPGERKLDAAVAPALRQGALVGAVGVGRERRGARREIDRTAVVRIDEGQVP